MVPQGNTLVIRVVERPVIGQISIEGNRRLSDENLSSLLKSVPRRVYVPATAEADAAAITAAYETRGNLAATVEPRIIRRSGNVVDLVFEVVEGRVTENARVSFVGNRDFSDRRLRRVLQTKQAGLFRMIFKSDTFIADRIEFDRTMLRDFYLSRGYVDFQVLDVTTELARERNATFITFQLQEGQQFRLGSLTASSQIPGVDASEFLRVGRLRSGVLYSPTLIENAITRMEGLATQKGLDFVRIEPVVTRDNRNLLLDIDFVLSRGPRVFVERIDIEGNQTTLDRVVRRQFRTVEGDPFNPREIRNAAARIRALNYFSTVDVNSREGSTPEQVIIGVDVEEQPTGSLGIGGSYSTDAGLGANLSFRETNFLGRGQTLQAQLDTTSDTRVAQLSFTEPALLGRDLSGTVSLFARRSERDNSKFNTENFGASLALGFPTGEYSRIQLRYTLEQKNVTSVADDISPIIAADLGDRVISSVGYSFRYDTRTDGIDPTRGVLLTFGQDFAGVGGDVNYVRTTALASYRQQLRNEDYVLRATVEGGNLTMLGSEDSRITDRFFLSSSQLRGFKYRGVGPRDLGAPGDDALGGLNYVAARLEFGFPIGALDELGISGGLFLDTGSVWGLDNTNGADGPGSVDDSFHLRSAVGLSLFWDTALGPLTFNFSEPVMSEDYDKPSRFDISLTTRF